MNGNHHLRLPGVLNAQQQLEAAAQQIIMQVLAIVPPGSSAALVVKGPPHIGIKGHAVYASMPMDAIIATIREMARHNNVKIDIDSTAAVDPVDKERIAAVHALAERLANKVRRALMFLPANPPAAIRSLREALGVAVEPAPTQEGEDAASIVTALLTEQVADDTPTLRQGIDMAIAVMEQWEDAVAARVANGASEAFARRIVQAAGLFSMLMQIGTLAERLDGAIGQLNKMGIVEQQPRPLDG